MAALRCLLAALLLALFAAPLWAAPDFRDGGPVEAARIIDGESVLLKDERVLRLVDIDVPSRGALAAEAKAALAELLAGRSLTVKFAGSEKDRQGRLLAQLYADTLWVQGELLGRGLARVAGSADQRIGLHEMLAIERRARSARRGLWSDASFAIVPAEEAGHHAGSFALATGTVAGVSTSSNGLLLFFGADTHTGLVLSVAPDVARLCRDSGFDLAALAGKPVLTRGYIDGSRRPTIAITYPEQIEVLKKLRAQKKAAPNTRSGPPASQAE